MLCKFTANCTIGGGHKRRICAICTSVLLTALIMTFAALALPIKASAEQSGNGWTFDETTGALTVTSNDGTVNWWLWDDGNLDKTIVQSAEIKDGVTQIKDGAFSGCTNLTSVSLPEGIVSIGNTAFYECSNLTSVTLPESLKKIGSSAFADCSSLTSVLIPTNIEQYEIEVNAFNNCPSLKTLFIPDYYSSTLHISVSGQTALINYNLNDGNFNITNIDLRNGMTEVELPDTIGGKEVKEVAEEFRDKVSSNGHTHKGGTATCTQKAACTLCGQEYGELKPHTGGTASCIAKAVCDACGQEYGDLAAHTLVKTGAVSPTCTAAGNDEYWTCSVCPKMFADGSGTAEITAIPTIAALPHNFVNGVCADCGAADPDYSQPTETEPPVTEPPVTDSSSTEPTGTQPPVTDPSDTEPTVTIPPVTAPTETYSSAKSPSGGYPLVIPYGYTTISNEKMFEDLAGASDGDTVVIDLNGNTDIDRSVFDEIRGRDVTVRFRLKGGAYWTVNGKDIEQSRKVDLGVRMNRMSASRDEIKELAGNKKTVKFTLRHNGKLGFSGILNVPINEKYNGKYANLYYYSKGFEFVGSSLISDGYAQFRFDHASEYIIVIDDYPHGEDVSAAAGAHSGGAPIDMSNSAGRGITVRDLAFEEKFRLSNKKRRCLFNPNNQ